MKKQHRSLLLVGSMLLTALLLFACRFNLPSLGNKPAEVPVQSGPGLLPDPAVGLAEVKSYHAVFQQDVSGDLDGSPFERHTRIELTRFSGQADFTREILGSQEVPTYFRAIMTGQAAYRWNNPVESCQGEAGTLQPGEILEPAGLLLPVMNTTKVGTETVNGIASGHYHFDESALALAAPKPSISGDVWLAEPGGYVVKYLMNASQPSQLTGKGMEVGQALSYELSQVEAVEALPLPAGCMAVPVDIPAMPEATDVVRASGMMEYGSAASAAEVVDFYYQKLDPLGWSAAREEPTGELKLPLGLLFIKGDLNLSINLAAAETGGLEVNLVVYNPAEQAAEAASTPEAVPTPAGPQPTIDAAASGLPEDVPLYPGSTALNPLGGLGVGFTAPDSPGEVSAFYKDKMAAAGWTLFTENASGDQITQIWKKDTRMASLVISLVDGKTNVIIMVTNL
jgi:hypothetical protein